MTIKFFCCLFSLQYTSIIYKRTPLKIGCVLKYIYRNIISLNLNLKIIHVHSIKCIAYDFRLHWIVYRLELAIDWVLGFFFFIITPQYSNLKFKIKFHMLFSHLQPKIFARFDIENRKPVVCVQQRTKNYICA